MNFVYQCLWNDLPCINGNSFTLYSIDTHFDASTTDSFYKEKKKKKKKKNIVGKGESVRNEQFLLFPQCFLPNQIIVSPFVHIFAIISLFATELEEPKIGKSGKELSILFQRLTNVF